MNGEHKQKYHKGGPKGAPGKGRGNGGQQRAPSGNSWRVAATNQGVHTQQPRKVPDNYPWREDELIDVDPTQMKAIVKMLTTIVIRHENQHAIARQDTAFVLFVRTDAPDSLAKSTYILAQQWHETKAKTPEQLRHPMRVILFQRVIKVTMEKFEMMVASPSSRSTAVSLDWMSTDEQMVHGLKWDSEARKHVKEYTSQNLTMMLEIRLSFGSDLRWLVKENPKWLGRSCWSDDMKRKAVCVAAQDDFGESSDDLQMVAKVSLKKTRETKVAVAEENTGSQPGADTAPVSSSKSEPRRRKKEFAWMDSDSDEDEERDQKADPDASLDESAKQAQEPSGSEDENADVSAGTLDGVETFGRMMVLAPALLKKLPRMLPEDAAAACRALSRTKFFDNDILRAMNALLKRLLLRDRLSIEQADDVLRCMASLNIYDEGVFSAIARQMKVRTSSLDQAVRGQWYDIYKGFKHSGDKDFYQLLEVPPLNALNPGYKRLRCVHHQRGCCAVGEACTYSHDPRAPIELESAFARPVSKVMMTQTQSNMGRDVYGGKDLSRQEAVGRALAVTKDVSQRLSESVREKQSKRVRLEAKAWVPGRPSHSWEKWTPTSCRATCRSQASKRFVVSGVLGGSSFCEFQRAGLCILTMEADDLDNLIADSLTGVQTALDDRKAAPAEAGRSAGEVVKQLTKELPQDQSSQPPGEDFFKDLVKSFQDENFQKVMADALQQSSTPAPSEAAAAPAAPAAVASSSPSTDASEDVLQKFMKSFGQAAGSDKDFEKSMSTLMSSMLSSDLLTEPLQQIADKLEPYLKEKKGLSKADRSRYEAQLKLYRQIVSVYKQNPDPLPDSAREQVQQMLNELQNLGQPPEEVMSQIVPQEATEGAESFEDFMKTMGLDSQLAGPEQELIRKIADDPEELTKAMKEMAAGMPEEACKQQ
ncbi:PEX19-1 [Symbiodinium microadriaticum]|nr:PEX19-1 [Symbiodinium sp. KB8]CAE7235829.1 PEX19-1 [Symbiodinium microadriaticum]